LQRFKFMFKQFGREPLWFRILIPTMLLCSIIFSSSWTAGFAYADSVAKLAVAVFFATFAIKLRMNARVSVIFSLLAVLCIYLAWIGYRG